MPHPTAPDPSYPERVSLEGTHHGQKQGLLQEGEECTDQRLQSCEAAELGGGVPAGTTEDLSPQVPLSGFPNAPQSQTGPRCPGASRQHVRCQSRGGSHLRERWGACLRFVSAKQICDCQFLFQTSEGPDSGGSHQPMYAPGPQWGWTS